MGVVEIKLERTYDPIALIAPTSIREFESQLGGLSCPESCV